MRIFSKLVAIQITWIIGVILIEIGMTNRETRSKHSAEHMMCNFLNTNRRLPTSMEEIKKASRFTDYCGTRRIAITLVDGSIRNIIAITLTCIISLLLKNIIPNNIMDTIIIFLVYMPTFFLTEKSKIISILVNVTTVPIKRALNRFLQHCNTSKNVKNDDIIIAYLAARQWMKLVYPEFYDKERDIFDKTVNISIKEKS